MNKANLSPATAIGAGLLAAGLLAAAPGLRAADQPGGYGTRPWNVPASETSLGPAAQPGEVRPEPATPHSLAVRWPIGGDDNGNAVVQVAYRKAPNGEWRAGFPLFWVHPERAPDYLQVPGGRLFAGSIVDLEPGTRYELRLDLVDPDGGSTRRTLSLETTREPVELAGLRRRHVHPGPGVGGSGTPDDPFRGLQAALAQAAPGDLLLLHAGTYQAGGTRPAKSGAPGQPIILRAAGDGPVILDGGGQPSLIDLSGLAHVWIEGLTLRNADKLIEAARAHHLVIRHNRFELVLKRKAAGVNARNTVGRETTGFFITDNLFLGPNGWPRQTRKKSPGEQVFGVGITGSGHVIAYNRMAHLGDGMNNGSGGHISASDVHNNDVIGATDDCLEADHATTNLRVYHNRLTNCRTGVSVQPSHGGPVYIFRNLIFNTAHSPFKLHNHTSGVLLFHNTSVREDRAFVIKPARETVNDVITRNNIFIGSGKQALRTSGVMTRCDFDNDGYAWDGKVFASWNRTRYKSPGSTRGTPGLYARHGPIVLSAWDEFANGVEPPDDHKVFQEPVLNDLRLDSDSRAVDAGVRLANFNDGFEGDAPDLGCCERGQLLPHFGPRP